MRVYYDFQIFVSQKYGGISRYFYELATRIRNMNVDVGIGCYNSINYYFRDELGMNSYSSNRIIKNIQVRTIGRMYTLLNRAKALHDMKNCDIVHPTYYNPYFLGRYKGKMVLTVHDMIHELYAFSNDRTTIPRKSRMIHAADRIIAISGSTKRDILRFFPDIDPGKISVIYHGASMPAVDVSLPSPAEGDYVLFVGTRGSYKNFLRFAEAMRPVLEARKNLRVFCAGGGNFSAAEIDALGNLSSRYCQASADDETLARLYANALCFVFPSEYEGFGIPILESFACNCPLVCSNSSSFPEVAGDAAEYFDPLNAEEMSAKILRVVDDESLREKMRALGRERLKLFDWDKTARETLDVYRKVLEG